MVICNYVKARFYLCLYSFFLYFLYPVRVMLMLILSLCQVIGFQLSKLASETTCVAMRTAFWVFTGPRAIEASGTVSPSRNTPWTMRRIKFTVHSMLLQKGDGISMFKDILGFERSSRGAVDRPTSSHAPFHASWNHAVTIAAPFHQGSRSSKSPWEPFHYYYVRWDGS